MDTPDPTPRPWQRLAADAHAQPPPLIDVRAAVHAALLAERVPQAAPSWSEGLLEFLRLPWARWSLAGAFAAAGLLCVSGWWSLSQEMSDPIAIALRADAEELVVSAP